MSRNVYVEWLCPGSRALARVLLVILVAVVIAGCGQAETAGERARKEVVEVKKDHPYARHIRCSGRRSVTVHGTGGGSISAATSSCLWYERGQLVAGGP